MHSLAEIDGLELVGRAVGLEDVVLAYMAGAAGTGVPVTAEAS